MAQVVEYLPNKYKALSSNSSIPKQLIEYQNTALAGLHAKSASTYNLNSTIHPSKIAYDNIYNKPCYVTELKKQNCCIKSCMSRGSLRGSVCLPGHS
jgi:hypothetical protein